MTKADTQDVESSLKDRPDWGWRVALLLLAAAPIYAWTVVVLMVQTQANHYGLWLEIAAPFAWLLSFALIVLGLAPRRRVRHFEWSSSLRLVIYVGTAIVVGGTLVSMLVDAAPPTDTGPIIVCAAQNIVDGINPYLTGEEVCARQINEPVAMDTPLITGPFAHIKITNSVLLKVRNEDLKEGSNAGFLVYGYPPLQALWILPVAFAGFRVMDIYVLLLVGGMLTYMWWRANVPYRSLLVCATLLAICLDVTLGFLVSDPEIIGYMLLGGAFLLITRPREASVWMALAVLTTPNAWILMPVWVAMAAPLSHHGTRLRWFLGSLCALIIPLLVIWPRLPEYMVSYLTAKLIPLGVSIAELWGYPYPPSWIFFLLFAVSVLVCAVLAYRFPTWRYAMVCATSALWMISWRASSAYLMLGLWMAPALLAVWMATEGGRIEASAMDVAE